MFVVLIMVSTALFAVLASGETDPVIWTSRDEYAPGEVVYIYGDGFVKWSPVEIELYHPDLGTKTFTETPDLYGRFVFDGYISEWVSTPDIAVNVTATQALETGDIVATTQFWDPAAYIEGYTLRPFQRWTHGDVKGYNEGDSVPMSVVLSKNHIGADTVTIEFSVDFIDLNSPTNPTYGIDYLTQYWDDFPAAPFNTPSNSTEPFYVDPLEGTITSQWRMDNHASGEGGKQIAQVWNFTMDFEDDAETAIVLFGAHLTVSDPSTNLLGASYYPGSALHVNMTSIDPGVDEGHRDVPIMLGELLTPPDMELEKECTPTTVVEGDEITFTLSWTNTGQAIASCVALHDDLPYVVDIDPTSFLYWTSKNPTKLSISSSIEVSGNVFDWAIGYWVGTGYDSCVTPVTGYLQFTATVDTNEPGWYYNWANLTYSDDHGGSFEQEVAWCKFLIIAEPLIDIEKTGPLYAHVGDEITYTYTVTNTGDVDLTTDVVDDVIGMIADDLFLEAGASEELTGTYTVTGLEVDDPIPNTVTATGTDEYCRTTTDTASWEVDILHPDIQVFKEGDRSCAKVDEEINYKIWVVNPSEDTDLFDVVVYDSLLGSYYVGTLLGGETYYLDPIQIIVDEDNLDPLVNIATAEGEDALGTVVSASDSWQVDLLHPMLTVYKSADKACAEVGELVTYTIYVGNPSWDTTMYANVVDSMLGLDMMLTLVPGDYFEDDFDYVVKANDPDPLINTVYVRAWDYQQHTIWATASWSVEIYHPMIQITKEADKSCAEVGETVTYWINVTNPSTDTPMYATVTDEMLGGVVYEGLIAGGLTVPLVLPYVVQADDDDPLVNTVTVVAIDPQDHERTASAEWTVEIYHPDIDIEKGADESCAAIGDTVTYWINVSNPSWDTPMFAEVWDPMFGGIIFADWIPAGKYWNKSFEHIVSESDVDPIINWAWVYAYDPQDHDVYDEDSWTVDIYHPAVTIYKWADLLCAGLGDEIQYHITVTNPSDDTPLVLVQVTDIMFGGLVWEGSLAPLASTTLEGADLLYTVQADDPDPLENTATVYAKDPQDHEVRGESSWSIDFVHPDVLITKVGSLSCAKVGEAVTYTITVTNPQSADVWLNGTVTDDMLGQVWEFFNLIPGDFEVFTYTMAMPDVDPFTNTATVVATDHQDHEVSASASWSVDVVHPAVTITKEADLSCAAVGEIVTYWINVTNPSTADVWLNGTVYDQTLGESWEFTNLMPGQTLPFVIRVAMPDVDPFVNTAYVEAFDHQLHEVGAKASWSVDVVHPQIILTKEADKTCAEPGEVVKYWINVTNPSGADVWLNGTVYDQTLGESWDFTNLMPGQTLSYVVYVAMPDVDPFVNTAYVEAFDHQLHEVGAKDSWSVDVVHPMIEVTKVAEVTSVHEGDIIYYAITVSVPDEADVWMNGTVYDDALGWSGEFFNMVPGGSMTWFVQYMVTEDTLDPFENIVYVEAYDHQLHLRTDWDSWTVDILHPDIMVTKTGPEKASVGETITYYVTVTNTGDAVLYDVTVFDSLKGVIATISEFLVGDTVELSYSYVVPAGVGTLVNTVTADGHDFLYRWVDDTAVWEVFKYGIVTGFKFADINQNMEKDGTEPGLMNWLIILEGTTLSGDEVYMTRITDSTGFYEFTMLDAGTYTVSEFMLSGWVNILPITSSPLEIGSGSAESCDFANIPTGSVSGYKWNDMDADEYWDLGELGIPGWTIYLSGIDVNGDEFLLSTETLADGSYTFDGLLPGWYTVSEEIKDGWHAMTPTSVYIDVSLLLPFEVVGLNFGNVELGSISGYKWLDEYMNENRDGNEPYLPGWTIVLTGIADNGDIIGPLYAVTDANGEYMFDGLLPGVYTVTEVLKDGWHNVTPLSREVTVFDGSDITCAKFGNVELGSIFGWKFLDWDMDCTKDGNEPGIPGWEITVYGWLNDGDAMLPLMDFEGCTPFGPITIETAADGYWSFDGLLPGYYFVSEELVDGWYATTDPSVSFLVCSGTDIVDVKFGNVPYMCFYGYKVEDTDGDANWDLGEFGLPGWTIVVEGVRNDGVLVHMELTTDANGYFATCFNMLPGTYWVSELKQDGWLATSPASYYFVPPMVKEPTAYEFVFLNFELGEISGYKYEDMNGDGELDAGDQPIEGWAIYLSGPVSGETTTGPDGYFEFTGLTYGTYTVTEETRDGWVHMTPASYSVPISSGSCVSLDPFLNVELSKIWGYKFEDMNSNGVWDDGEHGLPGWTITMIWDADPTMYTTVTDETGYWEFTGLMPDSMYYLWEVKQEGWTPTTQVWWLGPITSGTDQRVPDFGNFKNVDITVFKYEDVNGDGRYDAEIDHPLPDWSFVVIGPGIVGGMTTIVTDITGYASVEVTAAGTYSVEEVLQDGWCPTTLTLQYVDVLSGTADPAVAMFGNFKCVTITLFKYEDMDSDGVYDGDDEPIAGWMFELSSFWNGAFSVYTGLDGKVDVTFCSSDVWFIYEEARDGWCPVNPESGSYMVYIQSGIAREWYSWTEQYLYEFGNFECVEIEVFKYLDTCSNGWYDPRFGDVPIDGWYIELYGPTGALIDSGWTDEDGYLSFTVCAAGIYTLVEEDRDGWSHITPLSGYYEIDILSGDRLIQAWFGNYLDVEVPIFKYEDANSNGVCDEGDRPVEDWYFELERDDGTVYSGYTDENGMLVLVVNRSGIYTLTEEDREGWTAINPAIGMSVVNVVSGIEIPTQVFGNFHDVTITVYKFEDMDGDGVFDAEDQPLSGWQYVVTGPWSGSGTVITTGTDGYATMTVDRAGDYRVEELVQDGWTPTTDVVVEVMVFSGWQLKTILFGNFEDIEITVFKYEDVNSDGVYTEGVDNPLEGWLIYAFSFDTYECLVAWTGTDGYATMTLTNGGWWEIYEFVEDGWCVVSPQGGFHMYLASSGDTPDAFEFGNFRCVLIDVFKYEDANSNGVYDAGESPLGGWYFELYTSSGLLWNYGWTGETGHLYFTVCHYDLWTVVEEDREGWTHITPSDGTLTVETPSGADPATLMFGNFMDVWIVVFKYHDRDSDGVYDGGIYPGADSPIWGWAFTIAGPGVTNAVAYTDENGYAYFLVNRAGTYTVTEEDRSGWVHVDPLDGVLETDVKSGCQPGVLMFGNFDTVTITVFKFDDILADGYYDGTDAPLEDWEFQLYEMIDDEWVLVDTQFTGADGYATFVLTHAGFYMVKEVLQAGWRCITYDSGSTDFTVLGGDRDQTFEFGNFKLGKISGYKWNDIDGDGVKDAGEPGLAGWTVWFLCVDPYYLTGFKVTGADGYYEFTGLPTGVYLVWEVCQAGWVPTSVDEVLVQIIGHTEREVDFLNFELGCIDGYKYEDMDGDGLLGTGDVALPGWTIYLYESGELVDMTTTDSNGHYEFCGLGPGTYNVQEEARTGWIATNDASETFLLTSGALVTVHTFLNFELGCIWGYKFEDMNSNGVWDEGEPAVEGWPIYMVRDSLPGTYVEYTNANGWFCFDGLEGDYYYVFEDVAEAKLAGWTPTTVTWALETVYSGDCIEIGPFGNFEDVDLEILKYEDMDGNGVFNAGDQPLEGWEFTVTGPCFAVPFVVETDEDGMAYVTLTSAGTYVVTEEDRAGWMHVSPASGTDEVSVVSGTMLKPMYFGNFELGRVYGHKYYDWNLNGQWDEGEAGLAGWTIWLNGTLVGGGWLNVTRITGSDGSFSVDGLPAGTYVVSERFEYSAAGWVPMTSPSVAVNVGSSSVTKVDFGNAVFGLVWGIKFYDKDLDGVKDLDEPGLAGWTIILEGYTDQGVYVSRETTTDGTGYYEFAEVQPGTYDVYEVVWPDWQPTTTQPVHISVAGSMVYFEIRVDLGNIRYATVYGYKFLDTYQNVYPYWPNGNFDEGEDGIGNWEITLQGRTNTGVLVDRVVYTDNYFDIGHYEFGELLPGTYWVNETMMEHFYATRPISNMIAIYPFPYGQVSMRIDFGNLLPEVDPELNFVLKKGVNLWSSPLEITGGLMASDLAAAIGPTALKISRYDTATKTYRSFLPAFNAADGPYDFPILVGVGYFVVTSADTAFVLEGDLTVNAVVSLTGGVNILGYTELTAMSASELASSITGAKVYKISYYDPVAKVYRSFLPGFNAPGSAYDFTLTQGRAYFVVTSAPATAYIGLAAAA